MLVRELLGYLNDADPDAVVLDLEPYADATAAAEIVQVTVVSGLWTCECHRMVDGHVDRIYYPTGAGPSIGWNPQTDKQHFERVLVLSTESLQAAGNHVPD